RRDRRRARTGAHLGQDAMSRRARAAPGWIALALALALTLALTLGAPGAARAHELRPALLSLTQVAGDDYDVELRVPVEVALRDAPVPIFPPGSEQLGGAVRTREAGT